MSGEKRFFIKTGLIIHWGFSSRKYVTSKTRESYLIPPPTTLIGALSYGLALIKKIPEEKDDRSSADLIREKILSVNTKINSPFVSYSDLSRILWFREREKSIKFDAVAIGKTYKGVSEDTKNIGDIEVIYLFKDLGEDERKDLFLASLSISRVGGSYGVVSVAYSEYGYAEKISRDEVNKYCVNYSTWSDLVEVENKDVPYLKELVIDYRRSVIGDYTSAVFREHLYFYRTDLLRPECSKVKLISDKASIYRVNGEMIIVEE